MGPARFHCATLLAGLMAVEPAGIYPLARKATMFFPMLKMSARSRFRRRIAHCPARAWIVSNFQKNSLFHEIRQHRSGYKFFLLVFKNTADCFLFRCSH